MKSRERTTDGERQIPEQPDSLPRVSAADRIRATTPPQRSRASNAWSAFGLWLIELTDRIEARKRAERESGR